MHALTQSFNHARPPQIDSDAVNRVLERKNKSVEQARMQTKAFTKWANSHLKTKGIKMDDITKDLSSGLNLCYMLSSMTGETVKPPNSAKKVHCAFVK